MRVDAVRDPGQRPELADGSAYALAFRYSFEAHPMCVRTALRDTLTRLGCHLTGDEAGTLELVLAEVFNNIVEHGYSSRGQGTIVLSIYPEEDALLCTVDDAGPALPPVCVDCPETSRPRPEDLPEGGFGWFLIHDLVRDLQYQRNAGRNLLVFRLPLNQDPCT